MQPCPICSKPTPGAVVGEVTHAACPACASEALKADGHEVPGELREQLQAEPKKERKRPVKA